MSSKSLDLCHPTRTAQADRSQYFLQSLESPFTQSMACNYISPLLYLYIYVSQESKGTVLFVFESLEFLLS